VTSVSTEPRDTDGPTPATAPTGGSAAQRERRRRILDATIKLAAEGGFDAVQMRAVAEQAEVALGTLYRYFPSKIHLLVSALAREFTKDVDRSAIRATPGDTAHERIMYVLNRRTRALQKQPRLTEALVRAFMFADQSVTGEIHEVGTSLTTVIARAMHGTPEHGEVTEEEAAIIRIISDVWLSALISWVTGRMDEKDVEKSIDVAVRLLLR